MTRRRTSKLCSACWQAGHFVTDCTTPSLTEAEARAPIAALRAQPDEGTRFDDWRQNQLAEEGYAELMARTPEQRAASPSLDLTPEA